MLVRSILNLQPQQKGLGAIRENCSQFLRECTTPLYIPLSSEYDDVRRVKVRKRKVDELIKETIDSAFGEFYNMSQRCVIASTVRVLTEDEKDLFYVFPINGYKYWYNTQIRDPRKTIQEMYSKQVDEEIISEVLKSTVQSTNIQEAADNKSAVVIYNIPYFYGVRVNNNTSNYKQLLRDITCQ